MGLFCWFNYHGIPPLHVFIVGKNTLVWSRYTCICKALFSSRTCISSQITIRNVTLQSVAMQCLLPIIYLLYLQCIYWRPMENEIASAFLNWDEWASSISNVHFVWFFESNTMGMGISWRGFLIFLIVCDWNTVSISIPETKAKFGYVHCTLVCILDQIKPFSRFWRNHP